MSISIPFKLGDAFIIVAAAIVIAVVNSASRMAIGLPLPGTTWGSSLAMIFLSVLLAAGLVGMQRIRPPQSATTAATSALIAGCIPMAVAFVFNDLSSWQAMARHLINLAVFAVTSLFIYEWSRRNSRHQAGPAGNSGTP